LFVGLSSVIVELDCIYVLFDNDFDLSLIGFDDFKIDDDNSNFFSDEDEIPDTPTEPKTKLGDIYQLGQHRLMCGDSLDMNNIEKLCDGSEIDIVYTDPPYGINVQTDRKFVSRTRLTKGNTFSKIIGDDSIESALRSYDLAEKIAPIVCLWGGNYYASELPPSACWLVWDKRAEENQRDMNSDCELAYVKHPTKKSVRIFRHLWKGMIKASESGSKRVHPTQKPIALAEWAIDELNNKATNVLDLFGEIGRAHV
jgi:DNA modification methylase